MTITDYLKRTNRTATDFAAECGIRTSTLCRIINGESVQPRVSTQKKIVKASGGLISYSDLWPIGEVSNA